MKANQNIPENQNNEPKDTKTALKNSEVMVTVEPEVNYMWICDYK